MYPIYSIITGGCKWLEKLYQREQGVPPIQNDSIVPKEAQLRVMWPNQIEQTSLVQVVGITIIKEVQISIDVHSEVRQTFSLVLEILVFNP